MMMKLKGMVKSCRSGLQRLIAASLIKNVMTDKTDNGLNIQKSGTYLRYFRMMTDATKVMTTWMIWIIRTILVKLTTYPLHSAFKDLIRLLSSI